MLYIDSDGVIADFYGWCRMFDPEINCTDSDKIRRLMVEHASECFLTCKKLPKAEGFLKAIRENDGIMVLTALTPVEKLARYCSKKQARRIVAVHRENKYRWFEMHGVPRNKVIITSGSTSKAAYCHKGDCLIDDYAKNIEEWQAAGGIGVLHVI